MATNAGMAVKGPVSSLSMRVLATLGRLHHRLLAHAADEAEPHVGDGRRAVEAAFGLHLADDVLERVLLVLVEVEPIEHQLVAFGQLARGEPRRDARALGMVLDERHDAVQAAMDGPVVLVGRAEVLAHGRLLEPRHMQGVVHQLGRALVLGRRDGDDGDAQQLLHLVHVDGAAVALHLVHHVEGQHHGHAQLHELHRQVQVALDVRGVHDVDDAARALVQQETARDHLLARVRRHGVDARQVGDERLGMALDAAVLAIHRHAGKVAHVLVRAGQLVEQRGLAAVLVAHEREGERRALRQRVLARPVVELAALAQARMRDGLARRAALSHVGAVAHVVDLDVARVVAPQRQLVAVDAHLDRVAHGRMLHHGHVDQRDDAHVQKMLSKRPLAAHRGHGCGFPDRKIVQSCQRVSPRVGGTTPSSCRLARLLSAPMVPRNPARSTGKLPMANAGARRPRRNARRPRRAQAQPNVSRETFVRMRGAGQKEKRRERGVPSACKRDG